MSASITSQRLETAYCWTPKLRLPMLGDLVNAENKRKSS